MRSSPKPTDYTAAMATKPLATVVVRRTYCTCRIRRANGAGLLWWPWPVRSGCAVGCGWERAVEEVSEADVLECVRAGRVLDCAEGAIRRRVDAGLLRRLCLEPRDRVDPRGLRLRNAAIVGLLDLAGLEVPFPLRFEGCEFDSPLVVEGAHLNELAVTGCSLLPGLLANGAHMGRDLDLSRSHIMGTHRTNASNTHGAAVWLCESNIGGRLLCAETIISTDGGRAIQADRMRTGGAVRFLDGFSALGEVRLLGAHVGGSLDLTGVHIVAPEGIALGLTDSSIGGSVFLTGGAHGRRAVIHGRLDMSSARVSGQFLVRNVELAAAPAVSGYSRFRETGTAFSAPRMTVGAEVTFEEDCLVSGGIDLSMSSMSSLLIDSGCSLRAPGKTALNLTNAEIMSTVVLGRGVSVEGTIRLAGAAVHGNLHLQGVRLSAPGDRSLIAAEGARIDGEVELEGLESDGGALTFRAAVIGSSFNANRARLRNSGGYTLSLVQANVKGSVRLAYEFESSGKVVLNRSVIDGRLLCTDGRFDCPAATEYNTRGHAIEAISAVINGGMDLGWQSVSPSVDFTNTRTAFLADDPARWPGQFAVSGFSYERLEQPQGSPSGRTWDHSARCAWLRRQAIYDAGPYEQAARVFRQHGYSNGAKSILVAQRRHARTAITGRASASRRALDAAYSFSVSYGYRPARVLWVIALLLILVTVTLQIPSARAAMRATTSAGTVFTTVGPLQPQGSGATHRTDACGDGQVRCFNPVFYAIDTVVPLVSLDQRDTWYPDTSTPAGVIMQWWLDLATILGWLLSSIFVLALAGLARSA
jgi:hypothetical protein